MGAKEKLLFYHLSFYGSCQNTIFSQLVKCITMDMTVLSIGDILFACSLNFVVVESEKLLLLFVIERKSILLRSLLILWFKGHNNIINYY